MGNIGEDLMHGEDDEDECSSIRDSLSTGECIGGSAEV